MRTLKQIKEQDGVNSLKTKAKSFIGIFAKPSQAITGSTAQGDSLHDHLMKWAAPPTKPSVMFRVRNGDGLYFVTRFKGKTLEWVIDPNKATRWDRTRTTTEQIIEAFAWILAVDVKCEDCE